MPNRAWQLNHGFFAAGLTKLELRHEGERNQEVNVRLRCPTRLQQFYWSDCCSSVCISRRSSSSLLSWDGFDSMSLAGPGWTLSCLGTASFLSLATMDSKLIPELSGSDPGFGRGGVRVDGAIAGGWMGRAGFGGFVLDTDAIGACPELDTGMSSCIRTTPD
jgi:hypothetical protein